MISLTIKIFIRFKNILSYQKRKFKRKLARFINYYFPNNFRFSSYPYISGDTLRNFSNHLFDETRSIITEKVQENDIVFLKSDLFEIYFRYIHPQINNRYILITHNSDRNISRDELLLIDDKIIHFFAQNLNEISTDKISVIPIGLENRHHLNNGKISDFKRFKNVKKENLILSSFIKMNSERLFIEELIKSNELIESKKFLDHRSFLNNLAKYKFALCPPGNGLDTHRFWECYLVDCFPIVVRSNFINNLENLKIPAIYLNDWEELNSFSSKLLEEKYLELKEVAEVTNYSYFNFWQNRIESKKIRS